MFLILKVSGLGSIAVVRIVVSLVRLKNRSQTNHNPKEPFGWFDDNSPGISMDRIGKTRQLHHCALCCFVCLWRMGEC